MLFGWRPYVIQSGSMMPRIKVGDIVIASPNHDPKLLLGHVTVFQDPDFPDRRIKTHRVIADRQGRAARHQGRCEPERRLRARTVWTRSRGSAG